MWLKPFIFIVSLFLSFDDLDKMSLENSPDKITVNGTSSNSSNDTALIPSPTIDESPENIYNVSTELNQKENDFLTLHLMLASHTDAGWIYTFEEYYQGDTKKDGGCVKCILNNVMDAFAQNPDRRYDMSEIGFFNRWWSDLNGTQKDAFRRFLKQDQFGFMNGAWVANDEATAYYDDIMENFILGHRWLKDNLDVDANIGWQMDSFGNSATHAGLMAQAGYDGLFFSRADHVDRVSRIKQKALQFNWAPPNPHNESVFTQMLYLVYYDSRFIPRDDKDSCNGVFCKGDLTSDQYKSLERFVKSQAKAFTTKNILLLVSGDFLLSEDAAIHYKGADAMIKYYDEHPEKKIKVKYSHLADYVAQVQQDILEQDLLSTIQTKHDDTYPYVEKIGHVWTGYFTSKSMYKMLVRDFSAYYNAIKLFLTRVLLINDPNLVEISQDHDRINKALDKLEQALSIAQHHDSVTGTMKNYVREDYEKIISEAKSDAESVLQPIMLKYLNEKIGEILTPADINYDWLYQDDNYDHLFDSEQTSAFAAFNPGSARTHLIRVKVPSSNYTVVNESNEEIPGDLICHNKDATKDCFIYFADDFAAHSTKAYKIIPSTQSNMLESSPITEDITLSIEDSLTLEVSKNLTDFEYKYCIDQETCTSDSLNLDYYFYTSYNNKSGPAPSGAYVFTPANQTKQVYSKIIYGKVYKGKYITLVQIFRKKLRTDIKLIHHLPERGLEIDTYLDPVYKKGTEIVMGIQSKSINNGDTVFYTDSNGYFMQKRIKDHKDDYNISVKEGLAINYYPMTSNMYIEDEESTQRLSLVTDRAQGVSSLKPGEIEVMIHRVTLADDWKGVNEALQEKDSKTGKPIRVTTRHFLSYSQPSVGVKDQRRQQQYDLDRAPHLWFFYSNIREFEGAQGSDGNELALPNLVKFFVRSYQPWEYIVRLNNLDDVEKKSVAIYDPTTMECSLLNNFAGGQGYKVESVRELYWMTTKDKSEISRNIMDPNSIDPMSEHNTDYSIIDLVPMEIRTFSIKLQDL